MKVIYKTLLLGLCALSLVSCKKLLPDDIDALGDDVDYTTREFNPTIGRNQIWENALSIGRGSTLPLEFKLVNIRTVDGDPATEMTDKFPVKVWKKAYSGEEKTLEEIEAKREIEYRPIFEVDTYSGHPMFWNYGNSSWIRTLPDSSYTFDVEISNSGGRKYIRDLKLKPYRERPYEPSIYDLESGIAPNSFVRPTLTSEIYGDRTGGVLFGSDIEVYFHKDEENTSSVPTLTFSMLDSVNNYIDIEKFSKTDWENLVHGFNPVFKDKKVTYELAYPIPLIKYNTHYTNTEGDRARAHFKYERKGYGGLREEAILGLDFSIFEEGHWEIQFRFRKESPKFEDE